LQPNIDELIKQNGSSDDVPQGLIRDLYRVFEKHDIDDDKRIMCLWMSKRGQLNTAMRSRAREPELAERLTEWLEEL
jgi:hypothetical protein